MNDLWWLDDEWPEDDEVAYEEDEVTEWELGWPVVEVPLVVLDEEDEEDEEDEQFAVERLKLELGSCEEALEAAAWEFYQARELLMESPLAGDPIFHQLAARLLVQTERILALLELDPCDLESRGMLPQLAR